MVPLLSAGWLLGLTAIAAWALLAWFRFHARLSAALGASLSELEALGIDTVQTEAEHAQILEVLHRAWVGTETGEHTWGHFAATVVAVDGHPRSTRSAELFLTPMRLEGEDTSSFLPARAVPAAQGVLVRLGSVGFVVVFGTVLWEIPVPGFGVEAAITWATLALRGMSFALVPPVTGYLLGWIVRWVAENGSHSLEDARVRLCGWLDDRYRPVTSIELLVRILEVLQSQRAPGGP